MIRFFYTLCFYCALPFIFFRLLWRSRQAPLYRKRLTERLGFCPHQLKNTVWVHAVSVGETIAAIPLIKALKTEYSTLPILITNMTPTGSARAQAAFGDSVYHAYLPYDVPDAIARFLQRVSPSILIIMETELWPNLFAACAKKQIPIVVTNARLSKKSAIGYRRIAPLTRELLNKVTILAAQAKEDAERFIALGMPKERVVITGNLKFDLELAKDLLEKSKSLRATLSTERLIWIAASTHPSEEEIILAAHKIIRASFPTALLILVPRHPERFNAVHQLCLQEGFSVARRSLSQQVESDTAIYLGDTMGELMLMYAVSDVAFVGGSFAMIGGHNMLEPAALSKPILTGPQLFNFAEISHMLFAAQGMLLVENAECLAQEVMRLFQDQHYRETMGEYALAVVTQNRGALQKQLESIKAVFNC